MQPHALSDSKNCPSYIDPLVPENVIVNNFAGELSEMRTWQNSRASGLSVTRPEPGRLKALRCASRTEDKIRQEAEMPEGIMPHRHQG